MSTAFEPIHLLVCSALGVGHFTPVSNFVSLLCERHSADVYVSFFAPLRPSEATKFRAPPSYPNLQVTSYVIADATPVIMVDLKTKADQLNTEISAMLARAHQKNWPEVSVVIHDSFAWYATQFVENHEGKAPLLEYLFNPSNCVPTELFSNEQAMQSILDGKTEFTFETGKTLKMAMMVEMFFGPKEPLLANEGKVSIFARGIGMLSADIAGLDQRLRSTLLHPTRITYALSPLALAQQNCPAQDDEACRWLHQQPERSVIFIALGSLYPMEKIGIHSLATALERLEHVRFLWAIDESKISIEGPELSKTFKERMSHRGLVLPWVDQPRVLAHKALRGFVSHCGWNSLVESVTFGGLPIVCLPLGSEQHVNAMVVEGIWESGICPLVQIGPPEREGPAPECEAPAVAERVARKSPYMARWRWPEAEGFCDVLQEVFFTKYDKFALNASRLQADCLKGVAPGGAVFENLKKFLHDVRSLRSGVA